MTEEIQITLLRSAYSQVVKEAQDASCAIFTASGRIVAQPVVIPGHLGSMKLMLAEVLKDIPVDALQADDVLISNDPYRGGSHLPDIAVFRPIVFAGRLVGFAGCTSCTIPMSAASCRAATRNARPNSTRKAW